MNINDTKFNEIKRLVKQMFKEDKFKDVEVKDGTKLAIADTDELATGVAIFVVDENGNQTPAPDGSVDLADGRTIVIKGGMVDSISEAAEAPTSDSPQDPANVSDPADVKNEGEAAADAPDAPATPESGGDSADVGTRLDALETSVAQILEILQGMTNTQETAMSKIEDSAPAVDAIKDGPLLDEAKEVSLSRYNSKLKGESRERLMNIVSKALEPKNKIETKPIYANPNGMSKLPTQFSKTKTEVKEERTEAFSFSKMKERAESGKKLGN